MLTDYIRAAMAQAHYEILDDGAYYGEIPALRGVLAMAETLETYREAGFDRPFTGGKHQFMVRGELRLVIPNPHSAKSAAICWPVFCVKPTSAAKSRKSCRA